MLSLYCSCVVVAAIPSFAVDVPLNRYTRMDLKSKENARRSFPSGEKRRSVMAGLATSQTVAFGRTEVWRECAAMEADPGMWRRRNGGVEGEPVSRERRRKTMLRGATLRRGNTSSSSSRQSGTKAVESSRLLTLLRVSGVAVSRSLGVGFDENALPG